MSNRESLVLNFSGSGAGSASGKQSEVCLDVVDVPDRILEALHWVRTLQLREVDAECKEMAAKIEELLKPVPAILAAAAEQLAEVA